MADTQQSEQGGAGRTLAIGTAVGVAAGFLADFLRKAAVQAPTVMAAMNKEGLKLA